MFVGCAIEIIVTVQNREISLGEFLGTNIQQMSSNVLPMFRVHVDDCWIDMAERLPVIFFDKRTKFRKRGFPETLSDNNRMNRPVRLMQEGK